MADNHSKEQRSKNMSRIRSANTKPEDIVRKYLHGRGLRYRKNDRRYPGHPDIVLPKYRTCVFVNGCFWHQHPGCRYAIKPATNQDYWLPKLKRNTERDAENKQLLESDGWNVLTIWECELKKEKRIQTLTALYNAIIAYKRDESTLSEE